MIVFIIISGILFITAIVCSLIQKSYQNKINQIKVAGTRKANDMTEMSEDNAGEMHDEVFNQSNVDLLVKLDKESKVLMIIATVCFLLGSASIIIGILLKKAAH